jgi:hypothetical protein
VLRVAYVLGLTLAVMLAPSASIACEIACASMSGAEMAMPAPDASPMPATGEHHACHRQVAPPDKAPFAGAVHACTHSDGLPTTFAERSIAPTLPPVAAVVLPMASFVVAGPVAWRTLARPPDRSPRLTPLRI